MGKHEAPPFKMVIEGGRMVPATAYDQERLESYRRGTKVNVRLTEEKDRVLVRKWWAIIGKAVKECATPWKTRDEASEAIKLSLGIVNLSKTIAGDWMQYPKSLTELTDPELVEAVEGMVAIIQHITGIDPDDWKKEIADIDAEDNSQSSDTPSPSDEGSDGAMSPGHTVAADLSPDDESATEQAAPSSTYSRADCLTAFMRTATDPALSVTERRELLAEMKDWWKDALSDDLPFVKDCLTTADKVAKGELQEAAARKYLDAIPAPKAGA